MIARLAIPFVLLVGCIETPQTAVDDAHQASVANEMNHYDVDEKRYASCDDAPVGSTCGLLFAQVSVEKFKISACGLGADDAITDDCEKQFVAVFYKQLRGRYPYADWQKVEAYCRGGTDRCISLRNVELALLQTHNANAQRRHDETMAGLETQHQSDSDDAALETFLLMGMGNGAAMQAAQASQAAGAAAAAAATPPPMPPPMFMH